MKLFIEILRITLSLASRAADLAFADLDQTEICQLKDALDRAQTVIEHLEELKGVDQTQIVLLQARIDELTQTITSLHEENRRLKEQSPEPFSKIQEPRHLAQGPSSLQIIDISRTMLAVSSESPSASSPIEETTAIDLNDLNMDDAVKDGYLSVSDSGFEDLGSDAGSEST
ncbi:hypothetical protein CORC01_05263 [Colletotrichum orchidophilum]|uniref:Uncharacterized protein n=1 Tax=Colletotrichum orchidophilum TaxID=1209926 RepID=A0A1G4BDL7_9PEZI|nr:uncharacterized protein CORC01_05263 [Colletotrichum orchidophilum]OHE99463.1 hypothetical protein CORC01_05263 [Colletotrichum orchidophilum]